MTVKIKIPLNLMPLSQGKEIFEVQARTAKEALLKLIEEAKGLKKELFYEDLSGLRPSIKVLVNEKELDHKFLDEPVEENAVIRLKLNVA